MRLTCLICKHDFEAGERFIVLESCCKYKNSTKTGVRLAICAKHMSQEITDALLINTPGFSSHENQVWAEKRIYG